MTTYTVNNEGHLDKAFRVRDGFKVVVAGEKAEVATTEPLTEEQLQALADDSVTVTEKKAKADTAEEGAKAVHRGGGSYSVMDGDKELAEKLTKDEAETFNGLDVEAKAKWLADRQA